MWDADSGDWRQMQSWFSEIFASGYFENVHLTLQCRVNVFTFDAGVYLVSSEKTACTGASDIIPATFRDV
jgi:hypothetical protein